MGRCWLFWDFVFETGLKFSSADGNTMVWSGLYSSCIRNFAKATVVLQLRKLNSDVLFFLSLMHQICFWWQQARPFKEAKGVAGALIS